MAALMLSKSFPVAKGFSDVWDLSSLVYLTVYIDVGNAGIPVFSHSWEHDSHIFTTDTSWMCVPRKGICGGF